MTRIKAAATLIAMALCAVLLQATPAAAAPGQIACASRADAGAICVLQRSNGYDAGFEGNVTSTVDFNLVTSSGRYGSSGAFVTRPGQYNSYFFAVGYKSWAYACIYSRDFKFAPLCTPTLYT